MVKRAMTSYGAGLGRINCSVVRGRINSSAMSEMTCCSEKPVTIPSSETHHSLPIRRESTFLTAAKAMTCSRAEVAKTSCVVGRATMCCLVNSQMILPRRRVRMSWRAEPGMIPLPGVVGVTRICSTWAMVRTTSSIRQARGIAWSSEPVFVRVT